MDSSEAKQEERWTAFVKLMEEKGVAVTATVRSGIDAAANAAETLAGTGRNVACVAVRESDAARAAERQGAACALLLQETRPTRNNRVKFLVVEAMLREVMVDPTLSRYDALVLADVSERQATSDVLLALVRKIKQHREELWVVLVSSPIEARLLASTFDPRSPPTIMSMEDQGFPVQIYYTERPCTDIVRDAVQAALQIHRKEGPGDILVFLTGEKEVEDAVHATTEELQSQPRSKGRALVPMPLHGNLSPPRREAALQLASRGCRKCVFSTAIAEGLLEMPGIVYVVDCCLAKMQVYDFKASMESVLVVPASQNQCNQRSDKAGILRPGKCFRLCTERAFNESLPQSHPPEIQRCDLVNILLRLKALGIQDLLRFEWVVPPSAEAIVQGLEMLHALKAIDDEGKLTHPLGTHMAELPLDAMMARALLAAGKFGCTEELVTLAALHITPSIWDIPIVDRKGLNDARAPFAVEEGDHITYLNVYNSWVRAGKTPNWCDEFRIRFRSLRKADHIRTQLKLHLQRIRIPCATSGQEVEPVLKALAAGFFANAATLQAGEFGEDGQPVFRSFRGGSRIHLQPVSVLHGSEPPLILYTKLIPGSQLHYVRDVSIIKAEWLTQLASHYYAHRG